MLRHFDRKRIFQEEVYRYEIRSQLNATNQKKNTGGKIWTVVNSAFFLWFLSSVVIGVISFSYARWDKQREIEREQRVKAALIEQENSQRARKLDAEISSRLTHFFHSQDIPKNVTETYKESEVLEIERIVEVPKDSPLLKSQRIETAAPEAKANSSRVEDDSEETVGEIIPISEDAIMSLNYPNGSQYKAGDPEYSNRSLLSLLVELESVVRPQDKNEISLVIDRFIKLQPEFESTLKKTRKLKAEGKPGNVKINAQTFNEFCESVSLKRWGVRIPTVTVTTSTITESEVREVTTYRYRAAQSNNGMQRTRKSAGLSASKARARR